MTIRKLLTSVLMCASAATLIAQTPQQRPVFRSDTNLIQVDAYPMKDGRIVENLQKADFEILEDGKPQNIESFDFVKVEPFTPEAEKRDPNTQEEGIELAADPKNRVFVLFLDTLNVSIEGARRARQPLVQMLNRVLAANDLFAVTTADQRPRDIVFGRKVMTTEDMLTRYWAWGQRDSIVLTPEERAIEPCTIDPKTGKPFMVVEGVMARPMIDVLVERRREDAVLTRLEELIDYLDAVRETRKSLLVFSEGWVLYEPDQSIMAELNKVADIPAIGVGQGGRLVMGSTAQHGALAACGGEIMRLAMLSDRARFRQLIERARRANVVFYPVNPIGLANFDLPVSKEVYATNRSTLNNPSASMARQDQERLTGRVDGLRDMASGTNGLAVVNTNDLNAGLERVANQLSAYYVMSYYTTNSKLDGKYRKIEVKLKQPGINVTARQGYRAMTEAEMSARNAPKPEAAPAATADTTENANALDVLSRIRPNADLYGRGVRTSPTELTVVAEVSPQLVEAGKWKDGGDLQIVLTTSTGEPAGSARARLAAATRGAMARVTIAADAAGPWSAQLRLRHEDDVLETTIAVAGAKTAAVLGEPLLFRAAPGAQAALNPAADFMFRRTERVHVEWALAGALESKDARLLDRAGNALPLQVTLGERPGVLAADVNLAPLSAGDYIIEVKVRSGGVPVTQKLAIRVRN